MMTSQVCPSGNVGYHADWPDQETDNPLVADDRNFYKEHADAEPSGKPHCGAPRMAAFLYRCPDTGMSVQGWIDEPAGEPDTENDTYTSVTCAVCGRIHMVNIWTKQVLGGGKAIDKRD